MAAPWVPVDIAPIRVCPLLAPEVASDWPSLLSSPLSWAMPRPHWANRSWPTLSWYASVSTARPRRKLRSSGCVLSSQPSVAATSDSDQPLPTARTRTLASRARPSRSCTAAVMAL